MLNVLLLEVPRELRGGDVTCVSMRYPDEYAIHEGRIVFLRVEDRECFSRSTELLSG